MYGKVFESMFSGSLVGAGPDVFAVWTYAIVHAVKGNVELNPRLLAAILGTTPETVEAAIAYLEQPDPLSRSQENKGRRLLKEGSFQYYLPTHAHYNAIRNQEERREYDRKRKQEWRKRQKMGQSHDVPTESAKSAHTEAEAYTDTETVQSIGKIWNDFASLHSLPSVERITKARRRKVKARCQEWKRDHGSELDALRLILDKAAERPFLFGKNDRGWQMSFDWLFKNEDNANRILEGGYASSKPKDDGGKLIY